MIMYLAESGGQMKSYIWGGQMNLYLADSGAWFKTVHKGARNNEGISRGGATHIEESGVPNAFCEVNILQSFYYVDEWTEEILIPQSKRFLLDSGAFTFFSKGGAVDWNEYIVRYADFINRNNIKHFFELDIDVLIGYEKVKHLRKRLEDMTGKPAIPVWHKSRGVEEYRKLCEEYDYISIGGIASKEIKKDEYKLFTPLLKEAHKCGARVHGLGFTNLRGLEKYKFDSVDSTTWTSGTRFGTLYTFNGKTVQQIKRPQGKRIRNPKETAIYNWNEWVKFAKYAECNL